MATVGEGVEYFVVVDGQQVGHYRGSTRFLVFSPDSQRLVFIGGTGGRDGRSFLVLDGKVGRSYKSLSHPVFSPASQRVAYVARQSGMRYVVADGREGKGYDDIEGRSLIFGPDSRRVAFVALTTKRRWGVFKTIHSHTVVIDGQNGENYDAIIAPPSEGSINFMIAPSGVESVAPKALGLGASNRRRESATPSRYPARTAPQSSCLPGRRFHIHRSRDK